MKVRIENTLGAKTMGDVLFFLLCFYSLKFAVHYFVNEKKTYTIKRNELFFKIVFSEILSKL